MCRVADGAVSKSAVVVARFNATLSLLSYGEKLEECTSR